MPKVDLNPIQSGGSVDPVNDPVGSVVKAVMVMVSFGLFFALMSAGRNTFEPLANQLFGMLPFVQTGSQSGGPWEGW